MLPLPPVDMWSLVAPLRICAYFHLAAEANRQRERERGKRESERGEGGGVVESGEEGVVGEEAGWCRPTGYRSPWVGPCPGPVGDGRGRRSAGEVPRAEGPGGAPPGRSGGEQGEVEWPGAAAAAVEEESGEEGSLACLWRVTVEVEGEEGGAVEEECLN